MLIRCAQFVPTAPALMESDGAIKLGSIGIGETESCIIISA